MSKKRSDKFGVVFSTDPDYNYQPEMDDAEETLPPEEQNLRIFIEEKGRKGKPVCIVAGFVGATDDLKDLAKTLKTYCGVGGSTKEGEIILQGTMRDKVRNKLLQLGYRAR